MVYNIHTGPPAALFPRNEESEMEHLLEICVDSLESALAAQEELSDFLTESQDLRSQLALLAEMEQLSAKNVLTYFPAVY